MQITKKIQKRNHDETLLEQHGKESEEHESDSGVEGHHKQEDETRVCGHCVFVNLRLVIGIREALGMILATTNSPKPAGHRAYLPLAKSSKREEMAN